MDDCSEAPPQEGDRKYHVLRLWLRYQRGVSKSAVALVPTTVDGDFRSLSMVSWACWYPTQDRPAHCRTECLRFTPSDHKAIELQEKIQRFQYLTSAGGARVVLVYEDLPLFDSVCSKVKPLWDEHAIFFTQDKKATPVIWKRNSFGTWAEQVLERLCIRFSPGAFSWENPLAKRMNQMVRLGDPNMEDNESIGYHEKLRVLEQENEMGTA